MRRMAFISSIMLATAVGWFFGLLTSPYATSKEPRFPQLTMEHLNDNQKPLGEQIVKVSSVGLGGPYNPMLRSPVFGQKMFDLLYYLRWQTSVPLKLNEFAILIIGRQWRPCMSAASSRAPSQPTCRFNSPRRWSSRSTSKPLGRSAAPFRSRCLVAPRR